MSAFSRKQDAYWRGLKAERLAAVFLKIKGYDILAQRFKTPVGEIDLMAKKGKTLVMVEVKQRSSMEDALESVTPKMRRRIEQAALYYLQRHTEHEACDLRFDVIAVRWPFLIRHLDNAWRPAA